MTLIVGILCQDGVVVGADGAATFGSLGQNTARQPTKKISIIGQSTIVAVSGYTGISTRMCGIVADAIDKGQLKNMRPHELMAHLRGRFYNEIFGMEIQASAQLQKLIGQTANDTALASSIVAMAIDGEPSLFNFEPGGAPDQMTEHLPVVAIGTGQSIADPFIAFIRRIFWPNRLPNVAEGIFVICWTLAHAIETAPGGIGKPTQVVVL